MSVAEQWALAPQNDRSAWAPWPLYVLAGGRSSRFGSDKALAQFRRRPLIAAATAPFQGLAGPTFAVVDRSDRLEGLGWPCVVDARPFGGPVAGLETALRHRGEGWLWLAPCDTVGLDVAMLESLRAAARPGLRAVAWRAGAEEADRWQPLPSLWHADALAVVATALCSGQRALWQVLDAVGAEAVPLPPNWGQVRSINTMEALAKAEAESLGEES